MSRSPEQHRRERRGARVHPRCGSRPSRPFRWRLGRKGPISRSGSRSWRPTCRSGGRRCAGSWRRQGTTSAMPHPVPRGG